MKCVQDLSGKITRVKNEIAIAMVETSKFSYINKEEWKKQRKTK